MGSHLKVAAAVVMVAMVAVWAARALLDDSGGDGAPARSSAPVTRPVGSSPTPATTSERAVRVVAAGEVAGVPAGYPRSGRGAATAAVNWVASLPTLVRMGPFRLADTMSRLMSAEASAAGSEEVVADYFELFDELGAGFASRVWIESPLQVTTDSADASSAVVSVWAMLVTGDQVDGPVEVLWRTHHVSLVWERDDWRIDDVTISEGPTPVPVAAALPSAPADFDAVDGWEPAVFVDTTSEVE